MVKYYQMKKMPFNMGFSLVEVLVTISIIVLMVGLAIPSYREYQRKTGLDYYSKLIKNEIQFARSYALSPPVTYSGAEMFGIRVDTANKKIVKVNKINTTQNDIENQLSIDNSYSLSSSHSVLFFKVGSNGELVEPSSNVTITLTDTKTSQSKTVTVNRSGLININ